MSFLFFFSVFCCSFFASSFLGCFLSGLLCLFSGPLGSVLCCLALVCFLPARFLAWGVCLSFPSSSNLPGLFCLVCVFLNKYFKCPFGFPFFYLPSFVDRCLLSPDGSLGGVAS